MSSSVTSPAIRLATGAASDVDTDVLIVPVFEGDAPATVWSWLDEASGGEVGRSTSSGEIRGRLYEIFVTPVTSRAAKARRIAGISAGKGAEFDLERLRKLAAAGALMAGGRKLTRVSFVVRGGLPAVDAVQAATEGLIL